MQVLIYAKNNPPFQPDLWKKNHASVPLSSYLNKTDASWSRNTGWPGTGECLLKLSHKKIWSAVVRKVFMYLGFLYQRVLKFLGSL